MSEAGNLIGRTFGRLQVLSLHSTKRGNQRIIRRWLCKCECGNEKDIDGCNLKNGHIRSCGCLQRESRAAFKPIVSHGHTVGGKSPTFNSWSSMIARCTNPKATKFHLYGGKGIRVCAAWMSFDLFLADMGERPRGTTLDRRDSSRDYEPGNCRWATADVQAQNTNKTKLTVEAVAAIRAMSATGTSRRTLAVQFGVSRGTIDCVVMRRTWKNADAALDAFRSGDK